MGMIGLGGVLGPSAQAEAMTPRPTVGQRRRAFLDRVRCGRRVLHVSGTGDDGNPGTAAAPLREINAAVARARPGDLVVVGSGSYGYTEVRGFRGRPDAWLGIMTAAPSTKAVIHVPPPTDNVVNVIGSSYVGIYGLEIAGDQDNPNTNCSGLSIYGDSHHVLVWANHVHDFPGGGVNCFDVSGSHDLLDISYNTIHGTSKWSPQNTSGISVYASRDLTSGGLLPGGYGYRIVGNYVYDVECRVPFTLGGFDFVTDGNAVSLDLIRDTHDYRKPILVADNVLVGCGGRAVHAYGTVNVLARDNVAAGNMRTASPAITGGAEMDGTTDRTVRFQGNVICPLHTGRTTDGTSTYRGNIILGGSQPVPAGNVDRRSAGLAYFRGPLGSDDLRRGAPRSAFRPR